ncbi:hypothetical protein SNEBB_010162 [Seison nebaliae]|nr:hypothetical protein SNEBB_010162 [Seison nebaliae]
MENNIETKQSSTSINGVRKRTKRNNYVTRPIGSAYVHVYRWPPNRANGVFNVLQEQLADFLGIKGFHRKFDLLTRRVIIDPKEKDYLLNRGIVSSVQINLGLTVLLLSEVWLIISVHYPDKLALLEGMGEEIRQLNEYYNSINIDELDETGDGDDVDENQIKQSTMSYNEKLQADRMKNRHQCVNIQTKRIFSSRNLKKNRVVKPGAYPVQLIANQPINKNISKNDEGLNSFHRHYDPYLTELSENPQLFHYTVESMNSMENELVVYLLAGKDALTNGQFKEFDADFVEKYFKRLHYPEDVFPTKMEETKTESQKRLSLVIDKMKNGSKSENFVNFETKLEHEKENRQLNMVEKNDDKMENISKEEEEPSSFVNKKTSVPTKSIDQLVLKASQQIDEKIERIELRKCQFGKICFICKLWNIPEHTIRSEMKQEKTNDDSFRSTRRSSLRTRYRENRIMDDISESCDDFILECTRCDLVYHISCLQMPEETAKKAIYFNWACSKCKHCEKCNKKDKFKNFIFCNHCDRGFHYTCENLDSKPSVDWLCGECAYREKHNKWMIHNANRISTSTRPRGRPLGSKNKPKRK